MNLDQLFNCSVCSDSDYITCPSGGLSSGVVCCCGLWLLMFWQIMQGLLDQYTLAGNPKGLEIVVWMTDYFSTRVKKLIQEYSIQRHWEAINEETGGFNDVMYQLYAITVIAILLHLVFGNLCGRCVSYKLKSFLSFVQKNQKHLTMAHLFDKPCFLGPLGLHVRTWVSFMVFCFLLRIESFAAKTGDIFCLLFRMTTYRDCMLTHMFLWLLVHKRDMK